VRLAATVSETAARIVVSDTGCGFADGVTYPDGYDDKPSHDQGSRGLGLRIVHAIAASHRGSVQIDRNDDGGASVELTLPRAE
jgi:signal transduction histidine kinase